MTIAGTNCRIIDSDGNSQVLSEDTERSNLTETTRSLLEHAKWVSEEVDDCKMLQCACMYRVRNCVWI